jgi:hypothetical protein
MLRVKLIKIAHYDQCVLIEIAATLALNQFQQRYTREMITNDPLLQSEETRLTEAKTKAWNNRFAAESTAYPPTLESILWIVAKSGYTKEVAPFMNLSKATRECKNLQRYMREVINMWGQTQLNYFCRRGMTSSVLRMLELPSIDVEAREGEREDGETCLILAAYEGHLDICRLLIDKGAQTEARDWNGRTPLHWAAEGGHIDFVRLLCNRGADIEAQSYHGWRPLHASIIYGQISVMKELIEVRNAEISVSSDGGWTALKWARENGNDVASYLLSHGAID